MRTAVCLLVPIGLYPPSPVCQLARYLAISRRDDPTRWGIPGGKVDPGENSLQALLREIFEEVGLVILPEDLVPIYSAVCEGDETFWVTTYVWNRPPGPLLEPVVVERGFVIDWMTEGALCDPRVSPFARYNDGVFKAYREYLS